MGVLPALILTLWGFRPMVLLSIFAFLCPHTWSHDENVDYPHLYQVIMGSYTLIVWVLKYFLFWGVLSALILILWFFRPIMLLSIFAFLCKPTWSHDENVDFPHLYQVIMGSYTLIVWVLKYFLIFGGFVRFDSHPFFTFVLWCFCPLLLFSVRHLYHVIMGSCALIVGVLKYFLIFGGFVRFDSDRFWFSSCFAFVHFWFSL